MPMMEVSIDVKPPAGSLSPSPVPIGGQSFSPITSSSPSRKRAFSEVEDHNNVAKPEQNKLQKCGDTNGQENQDPLRYDHQKMEIDKPVSNTLAPPPHTPTVEKDGFTFTSNANTPTTDNLTTTSGHTPPHPLNHNQNLPGQAPLTDSVTAAAAPPENKKQKLSPASKEARRLEKEERERLKQEEKAKKEAEKRAKEEERKKKEADREEEKKKREAEREEERKKREEKKKLKEEEKQAKEEEKRKKDEEKEKKERSQMRLNAFFVKPAASTPKPTNPVLTSPKKGIEQETVNPESTQSGLDEPLSDYRREFPAFFLQSNTQLSPAHRFQRDTEALNHIYQKLDNLLTNQQTPLPAYRGSELFSMIPYQRRKGQHIVPVKTILTNPQSSGNTVDLTAPTTSLRDQLKKLTMKSLKFGEDVRPSYYGTFTKTLSHSQALKICRAPYTRIIPDINYDYDSEAEWEEPEEGEDLDSEGEDELSEDGDDDMDGFLDDDEEQIDGKRRLIIGDQEPVCTGIKWQDEGKLDSDLEIYRIESLSETVQFPINPYSTTYWPKPKAVDQALPKVPSTLIPPKTTLHAYSTNPPSNTQVPLAPPSRSIPAVKGKPFPPECMTEFKEAVEGCDLTKAGLIEVLKKRFPKVSKDTLKDTVNAVAVRVGQKEAEKRWTCK